MYPTTWALGVIVPGDDYFAEIVKNDIKTLLLGALAPEHPPSCLG
jgi:hypothetical protein